MMIEDTEKQQFVNEFQELLDKLDELESPAFAENVSLMDFYKELCALKTEVKQESRQIKGALDSFKVVFNTLENSHQLLSNEMEQKAIQQANMAEDQAFSLLQPVLTDLLNLRDRLSSGLKALANYRPSLLSRILSKEHSHIQSFEQGQRMTLSYLDQALTSQHIKSTPTVGHPFDPLTMRAIATQYRDNVDIGIIIEEVQPGYFWRTKLLRFAEVTVNREEINHG